MESATQYAGFWKRAAALLIDSVAVGIVLSLLGIGNSAPYMMHGYYGNGMMYPHFYGAMLTGGILRLVLNWLYYALMESSKYQGTLGKMALGIKVTDLHHQRINFKRATGRYFAKILSALILCIGFIMAGFTEKKQALHDIIAKTLVVNK